MISLCCIIYVAVFNTGPDRNHATAWHTTTAMDLNTEIGTSIALYVTLTEAIAINNNGSIAANGFNSRTNEYKAYLLTPVPVALADLRKEIGRVARVTGLAIEVLIAHVLYDVHDIQATCATLTYFVNQVQALDGTKINQTLAAQVISNANAIEIAIGCQ